MILWTAKLDFDTDNLMAVCTNTLKIFLAVTIRHASSCSTLKFLTFAAIF